MDDEYNPPKDISHTQTEISFRIKRTIENPKFFLIDKISNDYISNHKKKHNLFLIIYDFKSIFNNDISNTILIKTNFYHNTNHINLKRN